MPKSGKIWGETEELYNNGVVSIHFLKIKKGGYCSEHYHRFKSNKFFIITGNLQIRIWTDDNNSDDTVVWAGESCEIEPGYYHQFRALTDVECLEVYETRLREPDIERRKKGGLAE